MAAGDKYAVDMASVTSLIRQWRGGAESVGRIAKRLEAIHARLESGVPTALVEGLIGEVPLFECLGKLAAATQAAAGLSGGLAEDTTTLEQNLDRYVKAEQEAEARLKAVQATGKSTDTGGAGRTSGPGSAGGSVASGGNGPQPPGSAQ